MRLADICTTGGVDYGSKDLLTDENGRFETDQVPQATMTVQAFKGGSAAYTHDLIKTPAEGVELTIVRGSRLEVVVDFGDKAKPKHYRVCIHSAKDSKLGWCGSGNVDANGRYTFENLPPDKWVVWGSTSPGPDGDETEKVTVELIAGKTAKVTLQTK